MSEVSFDRAHPEYVEGYVKPKRTLFDPRPVQDRESLLIGTNLLLPVVEVLLFFASKHPLLITSTQVVFQQTLRLSQ